MSGTNTELVLAFAVLNLDIHDKRNAQPNHLSVKHFTVYAQGLRVTMSVNIRECITTTE